MSVEPAEPIAAVVADIRAGRTHHPAAFDEAGIITSLSLLRQAQLPQPVVDCTAIFNMSLAADTIDLYDDHPSITPPWVDALLCYVNTFGNVICLQVHRRDWDGSTPTRSEWFTDNDVDWQRVRWIAETAIWVGGKSGNGRPMPTSGPCHMFRHAIHDDGSAADINWMALMGRRLSRHADGGDPNRTTWDAAMITTGSALNFLNASNVDVAEPVRPFPVRQRIRKTRVQVQTIVVRPPGKRRASTGQVRPVDSLDTPLTPVRGSFGHYGPQFKSGLLFGKYAGKFWRPAHARGAGAGDAQKDYVLKPGA